MELLDGGLGGTQTQKRKPRIAGGSGPLPPAARAPAATTSEPTPAFGARLFDPDEIAAHLEESMDLSFFEPEARAPVAAREPTPRSPPPPPMPIRRQEGLLPELAMQRAPPAPTAAQQLSPLSVPSAQAPARRGLSAVLPLALAAAVLGAVLCYQLYQLIVGLS